MGVAEHHVEHFRAQRVKIMPIEKAEEATMFAALPLRAIGDNRLSALELRTLAAIAYHDRFSLVRNGPGCFASHQTLAGRLGCHYTRVSTSVHHLVELGYVQSHVNPERRRNRIYRVVY
ncbi:MAG: helix-turn-helix domain-containing protein [Sphingobacteriales bacterium]|nr:MAG: helix-turn-helix domain-containing protein [Sphingobacteriales bacterium]